MRCVLVTGASRGIGFEFVRQYADIGYQVLATYRNPEASKEIRKLRGEIRTYKLDVASEEDIEKLAQELAGTPIDILICNAAILGGPRSRLENLDWAAWRRTLEVNLVGTMRVAAKLWPNVAVSEERKIVVMSSRAGLAREAKPHGSYLYRSSKAALNAVARMLALDLSNERVIVTMLNPGHVKTGIGGQRARTAPHRSVAMMLDVIKALTPAQSGHFLNADGTELPL
jgi:NAD(P)-dependent dehydrogenase (short-subunit alcohol dehydrogenase family)